MTSTEEVRYTPNLMERLRISTLPTSDTAATTTIVDGFTTAQSDHLGGSWSYTRHYLSTGILSTVTDPRGNTSSTQSDLAARPIIQTDAAGHETAISYSSCCDQPASITDALGHTINYAYKAPDGCKRDWTESRSELCPQGESPTRWGRVNIRNRKVAEYGTAIQPATYSYDEADRMTTLTLRAAPTRSASQTAPSEVSSGLGVWALKPRPAYRVADSDISTDPTGRSDGDTTTWAYHDATGLLLSKTLADGTQETREYNKLGLLGKITTARGKTHTYHYDVATYDVTRVDFNDDTNDKVYNQYGELLSDTSPDVGDGTSYSIIEQYDELGRNAGYQLQRDGSTIHQNRYSYDSTGRIASAGFHRSDGWRDFSYSYLAGTSLLTSLTHPSGITTARHYEPQRNLLTSIVESKDGTALSQKHYSYDPIARPTTRRMNERSDSFAYDSKTYDSKSQLTAAQLGTDSYDYSYDNIGNRKSAQELAEEITYATNSTNEYTAVNDFTPEYDADGNQTRLQTSTGIWSVDYNAENRPVKFTSADGSTIIEARYDKAPEGLEGDWRNLRSNVCPQGESPMGWGRVNMGRRAWKKVTENGAVTLHEAYIYRVPAAIPEEVSSGALVSNRSAVCLQIACEGLKQWYGAQHFITWDPTEPTATRPLALEKHGTWYSYGLDLSKNITELYANNGTIATSYSYSPFGAVEATGSTANPIQWSSEMYDDELALTYYNYRHYNPADGRWINRDPIAEEGGLNLYGFVGNRVWLFDSLGNKTFKKVDLRMDLSAHIIIQLKYDCSEQKFIIYAFTISTPGKSTPFIPNYSGAKYGNRNELLIRQITKITYSNEKATIDSQSAQEIDHTSILPEIQCDCNLSKERKQLYKITVKLSGSVKITTHITKTIRTFTHPDSDKKPKKNGFINDITSEGFIANDADHVNAQNDILLNEASDEIYVYGCKKCES